MKKKKSKKPVMSVPVPPISDPATVKVNAIAYKSWVKKIFGIFSPRKAST